MAQVVKYLSSSKWSKTKSSKLEYQKQSKTKPNKAEAADKEKLQILDHNSR
jgi:hypothetical protein